MHLGPPTIDLTHRALPVVLCCQLGRGLDPVCTSHHSKTVKWGSVDWLRTQRAALYQLGSLVDPAGPALPRTGEHCRQDERRDPVWMFITSLFPAFFPPKCFLQLSRDYRLPDESTFEMRSAVFGVVQQEAVPGQRGLECWLKKRKWLPSPPLSVPNWDRSGSILLFLSPHNLFRCTSPDE